MKGKEKKIKIRKKIEEMKRFVGGGPISLGRRLLSFIEKRLPFKGWNIWGNFKVTFDLLAFLAYEILLVLRLEWPGCFEFLCTIMKFHNNLGLY